MLENIILKDSFDNPRFNALKEFVKDLDFDINSKIKYGRTLLMIFSSCGLKEVVEVVEYLLEKGANPNIKDNSGWTALHYATNARNIDVINCLLKAGANPNSAEYNKLSLLGLVCVTNNHIDILKALLKAGAVWNPLDYNFIIPQEKLNITHKMHIESLINNFLNNDLVRHVWLYL